MENKEIELFKQSFRESLMDEIKTIQVLLDTCKEEMEECIKLVKAMGLLDEYKGENNND